MNREKSFFLPFAILFLCILVMFYQEDIANILKLYFSYLYLYLLPGYATVFSLLDKNTIKKFTGIEIFIFSFFIGLIISHLVVLYLTIFNFRNVLIYYLFPGVYSILLLCFLWYKKRIR